MSSEQQTSAQPLLCVSGCGFYGNPATLDMCSVCYRRHCLLNGAATATAPSPSATAAASTKAVASAATAAASTKAVASAATVLTGAAAPDSCFAPSVGAKGAASSSKNPDPSLAAAVAVEKKAPANRCASCKKKVGLTGFACRCGATYCGTHRYPEKHACGFDFKGAGRDAIASANPVIKGEKLTDKI